MLIYVKIHPEKYKNRLIKILIQLLGHEFSMMGFMYYVECEKIDDNVLCFNADMKKGTNDDELVKQAIENLKDWDGTITFNNNILYRETQNKIKEIFNYFNTLPLSEIYLMNRKKIILEKKININIQYRNHNKLQSYNFQLQKQFCQSSYIEEINDFDSNLIKIELGFSIHPKNLHLTILNKAHYLEHILIKQIKSKTDNVLQYNGFTTSTGFINIYIIFERQYCEEIYGILKDLLTLPLQQQDGIENIRISQETAMDEKRFILKSQSVLSAQFCFNDDIYSNDFSIQELSNIFHNYYNLQMLCVQYSGKLEQKIDPTNFMKLKQNQIKENQKTEVNELVPEMNIIQETFYQYPLPKKIDKEFTEFLLCLNTSNIQFTIFEDDIFIHQNKIKKIKYQIYSFNTRFLDIGQNIITPYLIEILQKKKHINNQENKYLESID